MVTSLLLTASQLQALFNKPTPTAILAFQRVFSFVQRTSTGAVIGASALAAPVNPGDLSFTAVSNTQLKLQYMGSDGTIRSNTLTLA